MDQPINLELLAPAGDMAALRAALDAGASAVYLGLRSLNARRRAKNFSNEELAQAVELAHQKKARVYLALNIDLTQREIGQAARILELARQCSVDAVLIRDPALLAFLAHFPGLEFHFSTQTCMTSSADVHAAAQLGIRRVVLARELSLAEIAAASAAAPVETEVFVQGALCFCVSGRCQLSSWAGGRSGNRGMCASPCRVPWTVDEEPADTPLSMHDLAAVHRLAELSRAGVRAIKIEGRLKTANWVAQAVSIYRRALAGEDPAALLEEARRLGAYTGRAMTSAYLDGQRTELTGLSGREAVARTMTQPAPEPAASYVHVPDDSDPSTYTLAVNVTDRGIEVRCVYAGRATEWRLPRTVVRRAEKAVSIGSLIEQLSGSPIEDCRLRESESNQPEFLLVPRAANGICDELTRIIRRTRKKLADETVRLELPEAVRSLLDTVTATEARRAAQNPLTLGQPPTRIRIEASRVTMMRPHAPAGGLIVEGLRPESLEAALAEPGTAPLIVALPSVFFEADVPWIAELCRRSAAAGATVEVNSWGGWHLARQAGATIEGGPGFPVLNALAAMVLQGHGMACVTFSEEADRRQLEDLTFHCGVPCSVVVYGRPALMISRVQPEPEMRHGRFEDRRDMRMRSRMEGGLWTFRPEAPFDLRGRRNPRIRARHLVMDLIAAPDPLAEWRSAPAADAITFNYDRSLV